MENKSFFDTINERFSCRDFKDEKITEDELNYLLKSAQLAPTAVNYQPQRIMVIENLNVIEKLKNATRFLFNAKTIIVVMYDKNVSWHRRNDNKDHGDIDASIVATHIMLAATSINLGTCFVCSFKENMIKEILGLPDNYVVTCLLPVGYPKEVLKHNTRNDINSFVTYKR